MESATLQWVRFEVAGCHLAADIFQVSRVLPWTSPTPYPNSPPFVLGIMRYENQVVPVIDLRHRFGFEPAAPDSATRLLLVTLDEGTFAFRIDRVGKIMRLGSETALQPPRHAAGIREDFIAAVVEEQEELICRLDFERVLSEEERRAISRL